MFKRLFQLVFAMLILLSLFLSLTPATNSMPMMWNDKIIHAISYFTLMMTLDFSWQSGRQLAIKSIIVLLYSGLVEYGQSFVPGREMSLADLAANASGILVFIVFVPLLWRRGIYRYLKLI